MNLFSEPPYETVFPTIDDRQQQAMFDLSQNSVCVCSGAIILDLQSSSLSAVAEKVVDELRSKGEIRATDRDGLLRALLQRRSQSEGAGARPLGGDIEMQTFSVTKQVTLGLGSISHR